MSAKPTRDRAAARAHAQQLREEQAQAARRRERWLRIGIAVAVLVAVVVVGAAVNATRNQVDTEAALPAGVTEADGGLPLGSADAPVTIDLWEDFQCPACADFEATNAPVLEQAVTDGDVLLVLHPLTFLDENLDNMSSVPAAQALGCTADAGDETALRFHGTVFANQPPETRGEEAWSEDDLVRWAEESGADGTDVRGCLDEERYAAWVDNVGRSGSSAGVTGTPTLFVGGERVPDDQLAAMFEDSSVLEQVVADAATAS
jgi:protein-disulfide isomerase